MKKQKKPDKKSLGTVIAEKARAKANSYSHSKRHGLLERGMAMIYDETDHAKTAAARC
jgi:hypothetical protein